MTTMLEKAARAAWLSVTGMTEADKDMTVCWWPETGLSVDADMFREAARAALTAIREPSLDLGVIGAGPVNEHMRGKCKADVFAAQDAFTAIIDAILEEPSKC
jgi:hypothetical protein